MKGMKKNVNNAKGSKSSSLNSKLSEDMVPPRPLRKTKSKTPSHSMTPETPATSHGKTCAAYSEISHTPR